MSEENTKTKVIISSNTSETLNVTEVRNTVEKILDCHVLSASLFDENQVLIEFSNRETAQKCLDIDLKLGEVLGKDVIIAEAKERKRKRKALIEQQEQREQELLEKEERKKKQKGWFKVQSNPIESNVAQMIAANTVCISGLPATLGNEEKLKDWFKNDGNDAGEIKQMIFRHDRSGSFIGIAFVEFVEKGGRDIAIQKFNRKMFDNKRIFVRPFVDPVQNYQLPKKTKK